MQKLSFFSTLLFFLAATSFAQVPTGGSGTSNITNPLGGPGATGVSTGVDLNYIFPSDTDPRGSNRQGEVDIFRVAPFVNLRHRSGPHFINADLKYEYSDYGFDRVFAYGDVDRLSGRLLYNYYFSRNWGVASIGGISLAGSNRSVFEGATFRGGIGPTYRGENFQLTGGIFVSTRLDDDPLILPLILVNWDVTEFFTIRVANNVTVIYDAPQSPWSVDLSLGFDGREFAWEDEAGSVGAARSDIDVNESAIGSTAGFNYTFDHGFFARIELTGLFNRKIEFRQNGREIQEYEVDAGFGAGFQLGYSF